VGILIAFSLNNWNEKRKARITEISILNELITGLSSDSENLNFNIDKHNQAIKSSIYMTGGIPYSKRIKNTLLRIFMT